MPDRLRLKIVACGVFEDELAAVAEQCANDLDVELLDAGLHEFPDRLRLDAQEAIDRAARTGGYDAVCLAYGLCGRGTVGLEARDVPVVIPRVHDCIALFLGGQRAYREQFARHPGTFYFTTGWYKHKTHPQAMHMRAARRFDPATHPRFGELSARYGEDNARYIVEFLESWRGNYRRAALIDYGLVTPEHEETTRTVAEAAGWQYERLEGSLVLLRSLAAGDWDEARFLVVPPGHRIASTHDDRLLEAQPAAGDGSTEGPSHPLVRQFVYGGDVSGDDAGALTLGIDAGGTYTDAVLYDLSSSRLLGKAKSLTTHDDLTRGIAGALSKLDQAVLGRAQYVCVSTTLATNAVVEGRGQPVGLVLMPYHRSMADGVRAPLLRCVGGRMNIHGEPEQPVDEAEVVRAGEEMVARGAAAFAVSGYASVRNPRHEQQVREVLRREFALSVVCGHELSERLNFVSRAYTAMLNARLLPLVEDLLGSVAQVLAQHGVRAPVFVVRGDGSVIRREVALERAVETVLSGPAASATGARFITGCADAVVVDMGGTTTDVALLKDGLLELNADGAQVGGWRTSVAAADVHTRGLGGDSAVRPKGAVGLEIGPERVVPLGLLAAQWPHVREELEELLARRDGVAPESCEFFVLVRRPAVEALEPLERRVVELLAERPCSRLDLARVSDSLAPELVRVKRLESLSLVRRSAVTPTDALNVLGCYEAGDREAALLGCRLLGRFLGLPGEDVARLIVAEVEYGLARAVAHRELAEYALTNHRHEDGLLDVALRGRPAEAFLLQWRQLRPVIGIGAPVAAFLPGACSILGTEPVIPADADVANAIGAAASRVTVRAHAHVRPDERGGYVVHTPDRRLAFGELEAAESAAREHIVQLLRERARRYGTEEDCVRLELRDHVAVLRDGGTQLIEVEVTGLLSGVPALACPAQ